MFSIAYVTLPHARPLRCKQFRWGGNRCLRTFIIIIVRNSLPARLQTLPILSEVKTHFKPSCSDWLFTNDVSTYYVLLICCCCGSILYRGCSPLSSRLTALAGDSACVTPSDPLLLAPRERCFGEWLQPVGLLSCQSSVQFSSRRHLCARKILYAFHPVS